jgi:hypothetical protein
MIDVIAGSLVSFLTLSVEEIRIKAQADTADAQVIFGTTANETITGVQYDSIDRVFIKNSLFDTSQRSQAGVH